MTCIQVIFQEIHIQNLFRNNPFQTYVYIYTKIIKKDRPIMLIAIYHKWDDLFKIQNYISNLNLDYSFYIRHYSLSVAKTILYCIPNNKKEE